MTVGLLSLASLVGFNGGRSQLVLDGVGAFANVMLGADDWEYGNNNGGGRQFGLPLASLRDINGMVTTIPASNSVTSNIGVPASAARPGNYIARAIGTGGSVGFGSAPSTGSFNGYIVSGTLNIVGSVTGSISDGQALSGTGLTVGTCLGVQLSSTTYQLNNYLTGLASTQTLGSSGSPVAMTSSNGSGTILGGSARLVISPGSSGNMFGTVLTVALNGPATPSSYISQIAVMHADDEMAWIADPFAFNPFFVSKIKAGRWAVLRDLNWSVSNISHVTTWATRKPTTYWSMSAQEIRQSIFCGAGANHSSGTPFAISSITYNSGTGLATVVTSTAHGQSGSFLVAIDGNTTATPTTPTFNGTYTATVVNTTTFTYPIPYTPTTPTTLGTANVGVYDYAMSFNDPVYGNGAPVDKQTIQFYFDVLACCAQNNNAAFQGTNCLWAGHPFVGGEIVAFQKGNNLPTNIGPQPYYVLSSGITSSSFQFSTIPGGSPVSFTVNNIGTFTGTLAAGVLTVSGYSGQTINVGSVINGSGVTAGTVITSFGTGSGGNGTYNVTGTQNIGPISMSTPGIVVASRMPTLNLNGAGAVALVGQGWSPLIGSSNYSNSPGSIPSPRDQNGSPCLATVIYDADLGVWMISGGNLGSGSGLVNGGPPELFLKLCKLVGAHPWYALPYRALWPMGSTTAVDYTTQLAVYIKNNMPGWMIPRFEPSNEIWNNVQPNTNYMEAKAFNVWNAQFSNGVFDSANAMGKIASTVGQAVNQIFGNGTHATVGSGYQVIIGTQIDTWSSSGSNGNEARFGSDNYVSQSQAAQSGYLKEAASLWCTHATGANYVQPSNQSYDQTVFNANYAVCFGSISAGILTVASFNNGTGTIVAGQTLTDFYGQIPAGVTVLAYGTSGTTGTGGVGTYALSASGFTTAPTTTMIASNATAVAQINSFVSTFAGSASNFNLAYVLNRFTNLQAYAATLTNGAGNALVTSPYEGGYGISEGAIGEAAKFSQDYATCMITGGTLSDGVTHVNGNYNDLIGIGVTFPSQFGFQGTNTPWSICDPDIYATPPAPIFAAAVAFN